APGAPLFPVLPRIAGWVALATRFGGARQRGPAAAPTPPPAPPPPPAAAILRGRVVAADGAVLEGIDVEIRRGAQTKKIAAGADGQFTAEGVAGETVSVSVEAAGA